MNFCIKLIKGIQIALQNKHAKKIQNRCCKIKFFPNTQPAPPSQFNRSSLATRTHTRTHSSTMVHFALKY
uniref:Uncharacterized protein n=1 Tax=Anguilla anguilla TaxID=7936 RepID=A0A0E9QM87_ANGAN